MTTPQPENSKATSQPEKSDKASVGKLEIFHKAVYPTLALVLAGIGLVLTGIGLYVAWNVLGVQQKAQDQRIQKLEEFNERLSDHQAKFEMEKKRNVQSEAENLQRATSLYEKSLRLQERTERIFIELYLGDDHVHLLSLPPDISIKMVAHLEAKLSPSADELNLLRLTAQASEVHRRIYNIILRYRKEKRENTARIKEEYERAEEGYKEEYERAEKENKARTEEEKAASKLESAASQLARIDANLARMEAYSKKSDAKRERYNKHYDRIQNERNRIDSKRDNEIGFEVGRFKQLTSQQVELAKKLGMFQHLEQ